ncbi:MAG: OmcA/MtrC family decaheme c-type cytochrome [Chloroflexi bacterium]|nr:OmcA/MtrC family decaheme c-type cytochrome [Chloroflexota bacterium]
MRGAKSLSLVAGILAAGLALTLAACAGPVGPAGPTGPAGPAGPEAVVPADGVVSTITDVTIGADRKPVVSFTVADGKGQPLKISDLGGYPRFTIAYVKEDAATKLTEYVNYVLADVTGAPFTYKGETKQPVLASVKARPGYDPLPTPAPVFPAPLPGLKEVARGSYTYTFVTALPEGFDRNATHVVGGAITRLDPITKATSTFAANPIFEFVPAGGEVKATRKVVATASCNQCHDPLALHGGSRRETRLCVLCHTPQNIDPESGNTPLFKVMIHKIHRGANLPSVKAGTPYFIVGNAQNVADFSEIGWPQDIRNCTTCHGRPPAGVKAEDYAKLAPQADNYKTAPSRAACGACHDNIDFATGKAINKGTRDHPGGAQANDQLCATCHVADSGAEFDASVVGAHVIPERSKQLQGVVLALDGATVKPGEKPQVDFSLKDGAGVALDPNKFDFLELTYAYPTTDYANRVTENVNQIVAPPAAPFVRAGTLADLGGGKYRYTFSAPIDASAKGSVGIGMGGYRNVTIKGNEGKDVLVREANINPVIYASLDATKAVARRSVVDRNNCNQCHLDLGNPAGMSLHGGIRRNTEYCILCHNPNQTDEARRPKEKMPPESIQYKYMIHSLHIGEERSVPTEFIGRAVAATEEVFFPTPGGQANCTKCHKAGTQTIPLPAGVLPMTVTQEGKVVSVTQPISAACKACHIGKPGFDAHADTMTSAKFGEACANCHGEGADFAVTKVHQLLRR